uniref:DUF996 domain-containing protein n=1 Tax=candidate division WOR-3 bacterium TaxID=2052148 RepID=A0A7C2NZ25_UNCW3
MEKIELKSIKYYGGIGVVLTLLGGIRRIGPLFRIAGIVLILIALSELAQKLKEDKIFRQYLIGVIINIVGTGFALIMAIITGAWSIAKTILWGSYGGYYEILSEIGFSFIFFLILVYAITILTNYFYRESLKIITNKTGKKTFSIAGDLLFYGAIGTVAILGVFAMYIGWIILSVAFFSLPDFVETGISEGQPPEVPQG